MANFQPYEQGGILGSVKQKQLSDALAGVQSPGLVSDTAAPSAAPAPAPKNVGVGDVLPFLRQNYNHTPQDLARAFQEHPDQFTGASIMGSKGDKIKFANGEIHDVIQSAGTGGTAWQDIWDNDPNARPAPQSGGFVSSPGVGSLLTQMLGGGGSAQDNIQQALAAYQQPGLLERLIAGLSGG